MTDPVDASDSLERQGSVVASGSRQLSRTVRLFAPTSMAAFVVLGLPDGMLGVAWPQMRHTHHQPVSALSVLVLTGTCAFFLMTMTSGAVVRRYGASRAVIIASVGAIAGALATALGQGFSSALLGVALLGGCGGLVDSSLSSVVSIAGSTRLMGLLHACYGGGAAAAPLVVAACVSSGSWRTAYLILAGAQLAVLSCWLGSGAWRSLPVPAVRNAPPATARVRRAPAIVGLAVFFFVSGLEIAAGAWAAIYLTDSLRQTPAVTGLCVFGYWTALTLSRLSVGIWGGGEEMTWMVVGCVAASFGCALFWWSPSAICAVVGLVLLAAGSGPVLPLLTSLTPQRVGHGATARVIGWQLSAASLGSAFVSGVVGLGVQHAGLGAVGFVLTAVAVVVTALMLLLQRISAAVSTAQPMRAGGISLEPQG